jgi:uncharacterized protein YegP (UPF0339 family)
LSTLKTVTTQLFFINHLTDFFMVIIEQHNINTGTTDYTFQVFQDDEGLYRWQITWGEEVVGTCNQGYKVKSSVYSNIQKQAKVLGIVAGMLENKGE